MRHSATRSLLDRDDVIIVASVSCIYGLVHLKPITACSCTSREGLPCPEKTF